MGVIYTFQTVSYVYLLDSTVAELAYYSGSVDLLLFILLLFTLFRKCLFQSWYSGSRLSHKAYLRNTPLWCKDLIAEFARCNALQWTTYILIFFSCLLLCSCMVKYKMFCKSICTYIATLQYSILTMTITEAVLYCNGLPNFCRLMLIP